MPDMTTEVETDPIQAERSRVREIRATCGREYRDIEARAIDEGWTIDQTKAACLDQIRARRSVSTQTYGGTRDYASLETPREVLTAACALMGGHGQIVAKSFANGERLANTLQRPTGWPELCAMALRLENKDIPTDRVAMIKAAMSTTSLPVSLGSSVEKVALMTYSELTSTFRTFVRIVSAANFRQGKAIRLAANSKLEIVGNGGEIKAGSIAEDAYSYQIATYARMFGVSRQDLINDDTGILNDLPLLLGNESARSVSDLVFSTIVGNSGSFWGSGNGNYASGGGTALSITSLSTAITTLRTRKDADSRIIGFQPNVLLVPAALEQTARQILNSTLVARQTATDGQLPMGNPFLDSGLTLAVESRLDATSATAWYLFSLPMHGAVLLALLNGRQGPIVEQAPEESDVLGMNWRGFLDCGVSLAEYRATVKNAGA